jgi:hypothetical protein
VARAHGIESLNLSRADHGIMHKIIACAKSQHEKKNKFSMKQG